MGAWWDIPGDTPGIIFESYTPNVTFETFFIISVKHELQFCGNPCFHKIRYIIAHLLQFCKSGRLFRPWNYCLKILTKNSIDFVYKTLGPGRYRRHIFNTLSWDPTCFLYPWNSFTQRLWIFNVITKATSKR